jgi:integrase
MAGKQAKVLAAPDLVDLLAFAECTRHPTRNRVIVLLSAKAGLRASEIANLTWDMVVDATGHIGTVIELRDGVAKNGSGRLIPIHHTLADALAGWRELSSGLGMWCGPSGSPIYGQRATTPETAVLRVGTLDDPTDMKITANIWTRSARPWAYIDPSSARHPGQPDPPVAKK